MAITNATLFSNSYNAIKTFLNGISGLDPRNRYKTNWIHPSRPNINKKGFDGYPFIILKSEVLEKRKTFDNNSEKVFRVTIEVYSDDASQVDTISDNIISNFQDETKLTDFSSREHTSSPIAYTLDLNGKKITYRMIGLIFRSKI